MQPLRPRMPRRCFRRSRLRRSSGPWIDIPGTTCADGSPTGIGVKPHQIARTDLLIFLEGGGACWDANSCWGLAPESVYITGGYGAAQLAADPQIPVMLPFDRGNMSNPFRNMNWVYIPYCTGDVQAGDNIITYTLAGIDHVTHHVGYRNLSIDLQHIVVLRPFRALPVTYGSLATAREGFGFGAQTSSKSSTPSRP